MNLYWKNVHWIQLHVSEEAGTSNRKLIRFSEIDGKDKT